MILIGLGSSLPLCGRPPQIVIGLAVSALGAHFGVLHVSSLYASPAWPDPSEPAFINAVVALENAPVPETLLQALHAIEAAFGRRRERLNGPRTLDLDLLAYGDRVCEGPLTLPHRGLETRDFVLAPLAEIAPGFRSPRSGLTVAELLSGIALVGAKKVGATKIWAKRAET